MRYIDAEKLIAEIERLQQEALQSAATEKVEKRLAWQRQVHFYEGKASAYKSVLAFLDTLPKEKPSEDLKEELDRWRHHHFAGERDGLLYSGEYLLRDSQLDIARHFAEWQKAKMMEKAVKGYILSTLAERGSKVSVCSGYLPESLGIMCDDKVEIIIVKKD